jgi:hypothetical protein
MDKPTPPTKPNLDELHRHALAMDSWFKSVITNGIQTPSLPEVTLAKIVTDNAVEYSGRMFINKDTGKINYFNINPTTKVLTRGVLA